MLGAASDASALTRQERCQANLARASRRYFTQALSARQKCFKRQFTSGIPLALDCAADIDAVGDPSTRDQLVKALTKLRKGIEQNCQGIDLSALGFPGRLCEEPPLGQPFTEAALFRCVSTEHDNVIEVLLAIETPRLDTVFNTDAAIRCYNTISQRGRRMTKRELGARQNCMMDELRNPLPGVFPVDCREQMPPYGQGTGDESTDKIIIGAYSNLLVRIPSACAPANVEVIYAGGDCEDLTEGAFGIFDLQQCIFESHRIADGCREILASASLTIHNRYRQRRSPCAGCERAPRVLRRTIRR